MGISSARLTAGAASIAFKVMDAEWSTSCHPGKTAGLKPYSTDSKAELTALIRGQERWPSMRKAICMEQHKTVAAENAPPIAESFTGSARLGGRPAGYVYGTTYHGGNFGFGTVFKIDPSGAETVLYSFTGGADGGGPQAALVSDGDRNLYGPTSYGGDLSCPAQYPIGCGTIFKVDASGKETVVHTFIGYPTDGNGPVSTLVRDTAGNLYGTAGGGNSTACLNSNNEPSGCGVVFRLKTNGREAILHNFSFGPDGTQPQGLNLVGRTLYGATLEGGPGGGTGTVFKLTGW